MVPMPSLLSMKVTKKYLDRWKQSLQVNYLNIIEINHCKFRYCIKIPFCNRQKTKIDI